MLPVIARLPNVPAALAVAGAACWFAWAAPVRAQDSNDELFATLAIEDMADNALKGDYLIVGAGIISVPDYEGADENILTPVGGAIGRIGGIGFRLRGPSLTIDLIDDPSGARLTYRLGPLLRYRINRSETVEDEAVARLGQLDAVFEAGIGGGIGLRRLLTGQDSLSLGIGARWDVSGRGAGHSLSAGASYLLPLSRGQVAGMAASAEWVSGKYARYNYGISPAQSAASGLPAFAARGGFNQAGIGVFTAWDLGGNILDGGWLLGLGVLYRRLHGSAARTPLTSIRGDRDQWMSGAGLGYTF